MSNKESIQILDYYHGCEQISDLCKEMYVEGTDLYWEYFMKLPIGSSTIESACKNVIGGRLKQEGMTWSPSGAEGMLQIRPSIKSGRFYNDFKRTLQNAA